MGKVFGYVNVLGRCGGILAPLMSELVQPNVLLIILGIVALICSVSLKKQKH